MFSSANSTNPFSHLPSSSAAAPPPFVADNPAGDDVFLYYYLSNNIDPVAAPVLATNPQLKLPVEAFWSTGNEAGAGGAAKRAKKDRHRKICTAQGVRDRRVRLSLQIAREFFDLQDMLGFNKASKTLEWLLANSQNAINELAKMKHIDRSGGGEAVARDDGDPQEENQSVEKKLQKTTCVNVVGKGSTIRADGGARERSDRKICRIKKCHVWKSCPDHQSTASMLDEQVAASEHHQLANNANEPSGRTVSVEYPIAMIKGEVKPTSILDYTQQDAYFPDDFPQNWDANCAMAHSKLCTLSSYVNLSK